VHIFLLSASHFVESQLIQSYLLLCVTYPEGRLEIMHVMGLKYFVMWVLCLNWDYGMICHLLSESAVNVYAGRQVATPSEVQRTRFSWLGTNVTLSHIQYICTRQFRVPMKLVRLIKLRLDETYSKVCIGKHLSDNFPIQNGLKQGEALSPLFFKFALECH
jgi:hypothetical protein